MSTNQDISGDSLGHTQDNGQGRRPSTDSHQVRSAESPRVLRHGISPETPNINDTISRGSPARRALKLQYILQESRALEDQPDEARQWLRSLGNLLQDSDVSLSLRNLGSGDGQTLPSQTFLSVLAEWVALWFQRTERARKEHKTNRNGASREQADLDWLFQYVQDYLSLRHTNLTPDGLAKLLESTTSVCLRTNKQSDINNALEIVDLILRHYDFPKESLESTLVVLSASLSNLAETPKHLHTCFNLLVTGKLSTEVVNTLLEFIRTPTLHNNSKNLSHARGATRLLRSVIRTHRRSGGYVFELSRLADAMHDAAREEIFRFCVDILQCWHTMLSVEDRVNDILALDFRKVVESLELCLNTKPGITTAANSPVTVATTVSLPDDDGEKQYERHFRDREIAAKVIGTDLEYLWPSLGSKSQQIINRHVQKHPQFATSVQLIRGISELEKSRTFLPPSNDWQEQLAQLLSGIVQDQTVGVASRCEMIRVFDKALHIRNATTEEVTLPDQSIDPSITGHFISTVTQTYLDQLPLEREKTVIATMTAALHTIALLPEYPDGIEVQPATIIHGLHALAIQPADTSDVYEESAFQATTALAKIFADSLYVNTELMLITYDVLLEIASLQCRFRRSRLEAMRVLYRIRADSQGYVYFQTIPDNEYIAPALCRTRASADAFNFEPPSDQRKSASSSSLSTRSTSHENAWMYEDVLMPEIRSSASRKHVSIDTTEQDGSKHLPVLDITSWLLHVIRCLQTDADWETYSFALIHLGSQLGSVRLFNTSLYTIVKVRQVLCEQVVNSSFREPPTSSGLKKSDVAMCFFDILAQLIPYATIRREPIQKGFGDDLVRAFIMGIGGVYEGTSRGCIHALSICSFEIPSSVATLYPGIIDRLSKNMTQSHLTMYILEFLSQLASLPEVNTKFTQDEVTMIFGICIQFLEKVREQNHTSSQSQAPRLNTPARSSGLSLKRPPYRAEMLKDIGLPHYAAALAYHTMIFWFLSLELKYRAKYVSWIVPRLVYKNSKGEETIDEQSQVFIDMMQRTAFSDLGETLPHPMFAKPQDGPINTASWVVGLSIITAETAGRTGLTQITKRQASGTTHATYQQLTVPLPSHHIPGSIESTPKEVRDDETAEMLPSHILLQLVTTAAPTSDADQPVPLPKQDYVVRALETFDRIPTVDNFKIGVLFIGEGQSNEAEFLLNTGGTPDYDRFLGGLGSEVSLEPPLRFNPQGLQHPRDGKVTIAWRNRITEVIFLIPTLMPNDMEEDPDCINKKAHVGNCHVNIIFDRSGKRWDFENFKSQLNYVNIHIAPATSCDGEFRSSTTDSGTMSTSDSDLPQFYKVHVLTKDGFPNLSPAADPKTISAAELPRFVRVLALNANVFSQAWNSKDYDKEFPSTWRARLQQIKMLKDRVVAKSGRQNSESHVSGHVTSPTGGSSAQGRRTPVPRDELAGLKRDGALSMQLDFGRWTVRGNDGVR